MIDEVNDGFGWFSPYGKKGNGLSGKAQGGRYQNLHCFYCFLITEWNGLRLV